MRRRDVGVRGLSFCAGSCKEHFLICSGFPLLHFLTLAECCLGCGLLFPALHFVTRLLPDDGKYCGGALKYRCFCSRGGYSVFPLSGVDFRNLIFGTPYGPRGTLADFCNPSFVYLPSRRGEAARRVGIGCVRGVGRRGM